MILMPQIFDVTANENARYKSNELESLFSDCPKNTNMVEDVKYLISAKIR